MIAVGHIQANTQNTQFFVSPYILDSASSGCKGASINIRYGALNPGEFAYGSFDSDLLYETTPEMVDFSFELFNTFTSLPIGQHVKIAELHSSDGLIADLTLRKILKLTDVSMTNSFQNSSVIVSHKWQVIVKWHGYPLSEDSFVFDTKDLVKFNYISDDSDPDHPVKMISFGGDRISMAPLYLFNNSELATYSLGVIETSDTLNLGDQITFDINWSLDLTQ